MERERERLCAREKQLAAEVCVFGCVRACVCVYESQCVRTCLFACMYVFVAMSAFLFEDDSVLVACLRILELYR